MDEDCIYIDAEPPAGVKHPKTKNKGKHPSKLAELVAQKVKIKKEKQERQNHMLFSSMLLNNQQGHQFQQMQYFADMDLLPKSPLEQEALTQLRFMGFNNNDVEVMMALRAVQARAGGTNSNVSIEMLVEETMLYIVV